MCVQAYAGEYESGSKYFPPTPQQPQQGSQQNTRAASLGSSYIRHGPPTIVKLVFFCVCDGIVIFDLMWTRSIYVEIIAWFQWFFYNLRASQKPSVPAVLITFMYQYVSSRGRGDYWL